MWNPDPSTRLGRLGRLVAVTLLGTTVLPVALTPLNKLWTLIGMVLHKVMNPLVMGLLFFGFITPFGFLFRFMKGDVLRLKIDRSAASYWLPREEKDQPGGGMANQF